MGSFEFGVRTCGCVFFSLGFEGPVTGLVCVGVQVSLSRGLAFSRVGKKQVRTSEANAKP